MVEQDVEDLALPELPRPPTPPRGEGPGQLNTYKRSMKKRDSLPHHPTERDITPNSSLDSPNRSIHRKRVGFSESFQYSDPPTASWDGNAITRVVTPLPPSAERKPARSILKVTRYRDEQVSNLKVLPPHQYSTFAKMLESILQQLASGDKSSKIDSYVMLEGTLKATNDLPSTKALKENIGPLCRNIGRDIAHTITETTSDGETTRLDSKLAILSLKALVAIVFRPSIADAIPADFQAHLVDYGVRIFGEGGLSKEAVKHMLHAIALQKLSPSVMTAERVGRLVTALHYLEENFQGKSIVHGRLQLLQVLVRQCRAQMLTQTLWLRELLTDMVSSIKETRQEAIKFGLDVSHHLGTKKGPWAAISTLFDGEALIGDKPAPYAMWYAHRLNEMVTDKREAASSSVPQIWSVLILFQRFNPKALASWKHLNIFLKVLQRCVNGSDKQAAVEAQHAWNRFIFAIRLDEDTSPIARSSTLKPIIDQLKSTGRRKPAYHQRALGNAYTLLYYAFNPLGTTTRYDLFWDEYVVRLIETLTPEESDYEFAYRDATEAATILTSLFDLKPSQKWSETRAMDNITNSNVRLDEVPGLAPKWVRKNSGRVFPVVSRLLKKLYWGLADSSSAISKLWHSFIISTASATDNDATVSIETMTTVACVFEFLNQSWNAGPERFPNMSSRPSTSGLNHDFLASFEGLLSVAIAKLEKDERSMRPFTEKRLSITQDTFAAIVTPSHQPKKMMRGIIQSPLHHLVAILTKVSPGLKYDQRFSDMVYRILQPFDKQRTSSRAKIELINGLMDLLTSENVAPIGLLWQALASLASKAVDIRDSKEDKGLSEEPLGAEYRNMVKWLEIGIRLSPDQPLANWKILFDSLANSASVDAGDSGRALAVVEVICRALFQKSSSPESSPNGLLYLQYVLAKTTYPKDKQALDAAKRKLWGTTGAGHKMQTFDPYENLYRYMQMSLDEAYRTFSKASLHIYEGILSATVGLLSRCPTNLILGTLSKIQHGITYWVVDKDLKLGGGTIVGKSVLSLWSTALQMIPRVLDMYPHTRVLSDLEVLVCSGLETNHKTLVNASIASWNATFGNCEKDLEYPDRVKAALLRLRPEVDTAIKLPCFPESLDSEISVGGGQRLRFTESQDDYGEFPGTSTLDSIARVNPLLAQPGKRKFPNPTAQAIFESAKPVLLNSSRENTPLRATTKKKVTTPKLRHQDSQIQFEAIESSPIIDRVVDSQLLTDKQKETRDRQREDAALFPNIRSSPRTRTKSAEPELPIHRSSSKLRGLSSPRIARQSTPVLVPQSDDDQYVASSPTPTRSMKGDEELRPSPSPPPAPAYQQNALLTDDIPSSPPRESPEPEPMQDITEFNDFPSNFEEPEVDSDVELELVASPSPAALESDMMPATSREHTPQPSPLVESRDASALMVPGASDINQTISSYVPTSELDDDMSSPSTQLKVSLAERELGLSKEAKNNMVESGKSRAAIISNALAESPQPQINIQNTTTSNRRAMDERQPTTPLKALSVPIIKAQTPRTPQFVDANTSPASSNNIFEDAVEETMLSPRLDVEKIHKNLEPYSSLLENELDESSMLRVVHRVEQDAQSGDGSGSSRVAKQVSPVRDDAGSQPIQDEGSSRKRTRTSLLQTEDDSAITPPSKKRATSKKGVRQTPAADGQIVDLTTSSVPSLVPETPAPSQCLVLGVDKIYNDDGDLCTSEDTIVVDTTAWDLKRAKSASKKGPNRRKSGTKKRRFEEISPDGGEVPDTQEAALPDASQQSVDETMLENSQLEASQLENSQVEPIPASQKRSLRETIEVEDDEREQSLLASQPEPWQPAPEAEESQFRQKRQGRSRGDIIEREDRRLEKSQQSIPDSQQEQSQQEPEVEDSRPRKKRQGKDRHSVTDGEDSQSEESQDSFNDSYQSQSSFRSRGMVPVVRVSPRKHFTTTLPPVKKRRGRKPRNSQAEVTDSANQSFQSVDLDASVPDDSQTDAATSFPQTADEPVNGDSAMHNVEIDNEKSLEIPQTFEEFQPSKAHVNEEEDEHLGKEPAASGEEVVQPANEVAEADIEAIEAEKEDLSVVNGEDTTMYGSLIPEGPLEGVAEPDTVTRVDEPVEMFAKEAESIPFAPATSVDESSGGAQYFDGVKNKMQSLLTDLRSAVFGKHEFSELEDMMFDVKHELMRAKKRGDTADL